MRMHDFRYDVYLNGIYIRKVVVSSCDYPKAEIKVWKELEQLYPNTYQRLNIERHFKTPYAKWRSEQMKAKIIHLKTINYNTWLKTN